MSSHSGTVDSRLVDDVPSRRGEVDSAWSTVQRLLAPLASLRLTVALFFFSIVLIWVGTLAQVEKNMWEVIHDYFRCWIAWVDLQVFFPESFFQPPPRVPGGFWMPGGYLLGLVLAVNLIAAHVSRFQIQARGKRLGVGLAVIVIGVFLTTLIILGGHNREGLQGLPLISWDTLWNLIRGALVLTWIGSIIGLLSMDRGRRLEFWSLTAGAVALGLLSLLVLTRGDTMRLSDPSLRILWQLIQGGLAGLILLVGCLLVFKKRGGIVLIHTGIGLMMLGELLVGWNAVEEQVILAEGQTSSFARDTRAVELAIVDRSLPDRDQVVVIPGSRLAAGEVIQDEKLPFDVEVVELLKNATLRRVQPGDVHPATTGIGLRMLAEPVRSAGGAEAGGSVDVAAAYLRLIPKEHAEAAQTYLFAQQFGDADMMTQASTTPLPEVIDVDDTTYHVSLRYKRNYKPYRLTLHDIRKDDYLGTSTPRDYSSWISLTDPSRDFSRDKIRIWMNNPLRYAGETFYQSGYSQRPDGVEVSTLQVVANTGWMIPYVACMLAATGMLYHFLQTLLRFLRRRIEQAQRQATAPLALSSGIARPDPRAAASPWQAAWIVPLVCAVLGGVYVLSRVQPREVSVGGMRLDRFGQIPIVSGGRVKPIDTLARTTLRAVSDKQRLYVPKEGDLASGDYQHLKRLPATSWLLDVITQSDAARQERVFRIESLDVLATLGLERRKGFLYSVAEVSTGIEEFEKQAEAARRLAASDASQLTHYQRKLLETGRRLRTFSQLRSSFQPIPFPLVPSQEEQAEHPDQAKKTMEEIARWAAEVPRLNQSLMAGEPPLVVPIRGTEERWLPFAAAANEAYVGRVFSSELPSSRLIGWSSLIDAYARGDATAFNRAVTAYLKDVQADPPKGYDARKVWFEALIYNGFQPFIVAMSLYLIGFVLTAVSWLGWFQPLRRAALAVVLWAFVVHTLAIVARIYISGRPPVTDLYSSAVFIGWGCALAGLILEGMYKLGLGNLVSTVIGFATLIIAHNLAFGGDTFTVLQAVLDTQFWLATHVVCVSLGYATTFVAGGLAIVYILGSVLARSMRGVVGKSVSRMIYGILCFAIFFSFVGTVLGGLWADDSWGRFWGWDPKENGALMIVLWNALILHARWGGMVKDRGVAVLAVAGNVVTAWSWFGVNELGIGLHSYGFTEGVLPTLLLFAVSQLAIILIGCLPMKWWFRRSAPAAAAG